MSDKIRPSHLERSAYVYVRQSTLHQVRYHSESQRRQYALREKAHAFGFQDVVVIDDDLGRSGAGSQERPGFARLLVVVCEGRAGAVFAVEASRLARNNREWHHLVDLCSLTDTLVIDDDGIYDPRSLNDRLLLGLKGTMSEFELSLFRQRALEAFRQMVARGEVLTQVAVGYIRTPDNRCEMTPDKQVQQAIRSVFAKFREFGTVRQAFLWFRHEAISLPFLSPSRDTADVQWKPATYARLQAILKNPVYAGAFVYGRRATRTIVADGQPRKRSGRVLPPDQWPVLIRDHHEGYISWEEFLRNRDTLAQNSGRFTSMSPGPPKYGPALLSGLLRCRRCGRKLYVVYCGNRGARLTRYECRGSNARCSSEKCIGFPGLRVDRRVVHEVLRALRPIALEASLEAQERLVAGEDEKRRTLQLAVEKARYEVDRARRQYDAVDPANRLVAAELEKRWNEALVQQREMESRLQEITKNQGPPSAAERDRLLELGRDVEALWNHPQATPSMQKRILRTLLNEIVVDVSDRPREIQLHLHWAGGVHTRVHLARRRKGQHRQTTDQSVIELVTELAKFCPDESIAQTLNRLGKKTGKGNSWTRALVTSLRSKRNIPVFDSNAPRTWLNQEEAREELGLSWKWIDRLLHQGILPGRQVIPRTPWVIEREALKLPQVQAAVAAIRKHRRLPSTAPPQAGLPFKSKT